jgi:hypothetical protein
VAVVMLSLISSGCIGFVEPPTFPGAVRNFLDDPVAIYGFSVDEPDTLTLLVMLSPGELQELEILDTRCTEEGLVALVDGAEVGRLVDRCEIDTDEVWVLHAEGNYIAPYEGAATFYPRD